jgi:hypothetical protein
MLDDGGARSNRRAERRSGPERYVTYGGLDLDLAPWGFES